MTKLSKSERIRLKKEKFKKQKLINNDLKRKTIIMAQVQVLFSTTVKPHGYPTTLQFYVGTDEANLLPVGDVIDCGAGQDFLPQILQIPLEEQTNYFVKGIVINQDAPEGISSNVIPFTTPAVVVGSGAPEITDVTVTFP